MKLAPLISAVLALVASACSTDSFDSSAKGDSYESSVKQADEARKAGSLDQAIPLYSRALQSNPSGIEAKLGLGQSYLSMGAGDEAAAQFRDVLARRSSDTLMTFMAESSPGMAMKLGSPQLSPPSEEYRAANRALAWSLAAAPTKWL